MIIIYCLFAALLIWLSFRSYRGGVEYLRFFKRELEKPLSGYTPPVTVIAPFRGIDQNIDENLDALTHQDYPNFEMIFVVDDLEDPAVPMIEQRLGPCSKLIVAPTAADSSQKVENLRAAIAAADARSEAFVFVDSDVRVNSDWLMRLVAPLENEKIGASTGYRWFISANPTFASELRSAWNASIASSLGPKTSSNFCWGGSTAIRRDTFEKIEMAKKWKGTLSDDFAVTRAMKEEGLPIVFVPGALTASFDDTSFSEMLEFTTRQMKITRVYAPDLWLVSLLGSAIFTTVMITSVLILIFTEGMFSRAAAVITLGIVIAFSFAKARLRLKAVRLALPKYEPQLKRQRLGQYTLWLLTPAVFLYNCLAAQFSRRLTWRGTVYELKSPVETVIISD
jgi:ceramide glucosyltransferase